LVLTGIRFEKMSEGLDETRPGSDRRGGLPALGSAFEIQPSRDSSAWGGAAVLRVFRESALKWSSRTVTPAVIAPIELTFSVEDRMRWHLG